jgi:hypothetical protein
MDALRKMLYEQAKKCQTSGGAGLLLAIRGHLEGRMVYTGCPELWQAADAIVGQVAADKASIREWERRSKVRTIHALCEEYERLLDSAKPTET